MRKMAQNDLRK